MIQIKRNHSNRLAHASSPKDGRLEIVAATQQLHQLHQQHSVAPMCYDLVAHRTGSKLFKVSWQSATPQLDSQESTRLMVTGLRHVLSHSWLPVRLGWHLTAKQSEQTFVCFELVLCGQAHFIWRWLLLNDHLADSNNCLFSFFHSFGALFWSRNLSVSYQSSLFTC